MVQMDAHWKCINWVADWVNAEPALNHNLFGNSEDGIIVSADSDLFFQVQIIPEGVDGGLVLTAGLAYIIHPFLTI